MNNLKQKRHFKNLLFINPQLYNLIIQRYNSGFTHEQVLESTIIYLAEENKKLKERLNDYMINYPLLSFDDYLNYN